MTPPEPVGSGNILAQPFHVLVRKDGVYLFQQPALLQRFEINGLPPHLQATSNFLLNPRPGDGVLTDGSDFFGAAGAVSSGDPLKTSLQVWSPSGQSISNTTFTLTNDYGGASVAAFQGLALLRLDELTVVDTSGAVGETVPSLNPPPPILGAYGCGFFADETNTVQGSLTTIPLDGRPALTRTSPGGLPYSWPYDPHGVIFVTPPSTTACNASIDLVFDDGRPALHHDVTTPCGSDISILTTSLGALLVADGGLTLLDVDANAVGDTLSTGSFDYIPIGNYIAAITSSYSSTTETYAYWASIIGCGD